jgi:MFS family permease
VKEAPVSPNTIPRDLRLLLTTRALRSLAFGLVSVTLAVYLPDLGFGPTTMGLLFTASLVGSALTTLAVATFGDRVGRRRLLVASGVLLAGTGAVFAFTSDLRVLLLAAFVGIISPSAADVGSTLALEQAGLSEIVPTSRRAQAFGWANFLASLATAVGALATTGSTVIQQFGATRVEADRVLLGGYSVVGLGLVVLYSRLSASIEAPRTPATARNGVADLSRAGQVVAGFTSLLALNSFASSFVAQSFVGYWFHVRFGADLATLGVLFALTNLVGALSYPVAGWIAPRIGLINTMVFTHLPSNVLLMLIPAMPTFPFAAALLVLRHAFSQMDRPAREAFTVAMVPPNQRTAAAGIVSIATDVAAAIGLSVAGAAMQLVSPGAGFVVAGGLRIAYNLALFRGFRDLGPTEESRDTSALASQPPAN